MLTNILFSRAYGILIKVDYTAEHKHVSINLKIELLQSMFSDYNESIQKSIKNQKTPKLNNMLLNNLSVKKKSQIS